MTKEGPFTYVHTPTSDGVVSTQTFRIPDIPISLSVFDVTDSFIQGQCYVKVSLLVNGDPMMILCSGFINLMHSLGYPQQDNPDKRPGRGYFVRTNSANPAAGAEHAYTVPSNEIWRILSLTAALVTDGTAANRRPHFVFNANNLTSIHAFPLVDQTATQTITYNVAQYGVMPDELDNSQVLVNMPTETWVIGGNTIETVTTNIQAGDNWGIMYILAERFFN